MQPYLPFRPREIFEVLNRHRVVYVVIGAVGGGLHGSVLRTDDVDVCPAAHPKNLERLASALREMGARHWDPYKGDASDTTEVTGDDLAAGGTWMFLTDKGRLDVVFTPSGTRGYIDIARDAITMDLSGISVRVASLADIIRSKEAAGRERDRHQLPALRKLLEAGGNDDASV